MSKQGRCSGGVQFKPWLRILAVWLVTGLSAAAQLGPADPSFKAQIDAPGAVLDLVALPGGDLLACGRFLTVNDQPRRGLVRLRPDGSPDPTFSPEFNGTVNALAIQPDGKIVAVGSFSAVNGELRRNIVRLTPSGGVDASFAPMVDFEIKTVALQVFSTNDWRLVIGGIFSAVNGRTVNRLARLRADGSSDDGFRASVGENRSFEQVLSVAVAPDGRLYVAGDFSLVNGATRRYLARLRADGTLDNSFDLQAGPNGPVTKVVATSGERILISGRFTACNDFRREGLARLLEDGAVDPTFTPVYPDGIFFVEMSSLAEQPDGGWFVAGRFATADSQVYPRVIALDGNGRALSGFQIARAAHPAGGDLTINTIATLPSGKIAVGGRFGSLGPASHESLAVLQLSGVVDESFSARVRDEGGIVSILPQDDGRVVIAGRFSRVNGIPRQTLARLNADGSLDRGFDVGEGVLGNILAATLQADQKVVVGGIFREVNGTARTNLVRFNLDGSVDPEFAAGPDWVVRALAVQTNGQVLVGGEFFRVNGVTRPGIARLERDGSIDPSFNVSGADYKSVFAIALQPDQSILIGGNFSDGRIPPRNYLARLHPDGSLDESFDVGASLDSIVVTLSLDAYGRILVGGWFQSVDGQPRRGVARLLTNGSLDSSFDPFQIIYSRPVYFAAVDDDRILFGGDLYTTLTIGRWGVGRLLDNGQLDPEFALPPDEWIFVRAMGRQTNGALVVWSERNGADGSVESRLARYWSTPKTAFTLVRAHSAALGQFKFDLRVEGPVPATVAIEWSADLTHWNELTRLNPDSDLIPIVDETAAGPHRFYRAIVP